MDAIQESLHQLQDIFVKRMDQYQRDLQAAAPTSTSTSNLTTDFTTFRTFIMTALRSLQDQVQLLATQMDNMEMRSRRKILLIHGLAEQKQEDIGVMVAKLVTTQLKLPEFAVEDIGRCHRMGRMSSTSKPRPILVKLRDLNTRNKIWYAKTSLKGTGVTLSEFLTKPRHETFMEARKRFGITNCWTRDGLVYILGGDGRKHHITSISDVDKIIAPKLQKSTEIIKEPPVAPKNRRAAASKK